MFVECIVKQVNFVAEVTRHFHNGRSDQCDPIILTFTFRILFMLAWSAEC